MHYSTSIHFKMSHVIGAVNRAFADPMSLFMRQDSTGQELGLIEHHQRLVAGFEHLMDLG